MGQKFQKATEKEFRGVCHRQMINIPGDRYVKPTLNIAQ